MNDLSRPCHELADFLRERLDEDEAMAKAAQQTTMANGPLADQAGPCVSDEGYAYIDRFGPARVLREVTAKRAMVARHSRNPGTVFDSCDWCSHEAADYPWPCPDIRDLASAWADHPGYRAEWAPPL